RLREGQRVGQFQVDVAAGAVQRGAPLRDVGGVVGRVAPAARPDEVHLDVVDAPGGEQVGVGLDVLDRARLREVDAPRVAERVARCGGVGDVLRVVRGAEDGQVRLDGRLGDAGYQVDAEPQAQLVHVVGDRGDPVGELGGVPRVAPVPVEVVRPAGVHVDVPVPELLQVRMHRVRLRLDDRRADVAAQ